MNKPSQNVSYDNSIHDIECLSDNSKDILDCIKGCVSIIVPIYSVKSEYLNCCVESLAKQTYINIEIILIDDGSPDESGELCDVLASQYENIKVIHQKNQGVSVARNRGVSEASGEYIMFVDSDDWLEVNCVENAIYEMEEHKVDLLYFQYCEERENSTRYIQSKLSKEIDRSELWLIQIDMISTMDKFGYGMKPPWGKLIRKSVIINNYVIFPPGLKKSQDVVFNLYLLEFIEKAYSSDFVGYHYRVHDGSVSHRYNEEAPKIMVNILREYSKFVSIYHAENQQYKKSLGIRAFIQVGIIGSIYVFNPKCNLTKTEIIKVLDDYLNNELVVKYSNYCKVNDFLGRRRKVEYILIKCRFYKLYYFYCRTIKYRKNK